MRRSIPAIPAAALINLKGELVGINTAILSPAGGNVGIGFAVPINMARQVMEQIIQTGRVQRGRIGVSIQDPSAAGAVGEGALIAEVSPGSPAEVAGIRRGDLVVKADGMPIRSGAQLRNKVGLTPVGRSGPAHHQPRRRPAEHGACDRACRKRLARLP